MVDTTVLEIRYIQHIVSSPAVRIDDAVRDDFILDNGHQCRRSGIRDNLRVDLPLTLQKPEHRDFPSGAATTFTFASTTKVGSINFDLSTENRAGFLLKVVNDDLTQSMEIVNRGFAVGADKGCGASGRRTRNKIPDQPIPFRLAKSALSHTVHDNP